MTQKIGLFFCRCGPNLGEVVDLEALARGDRWPGAHVVELHPVLCSEEGRSWLSGRIVEEGLDRVVVAACSPREHETTFQRVLEGAGLNAHMLQMANIREQCEWVGGGRPAATAKAEDLVRAAMARILHHSALEATEMDCNPDVLVIGSGVAGLSAALTLLQKGRKVFIVEREYALGGRVARLDEIYPGMECASCFVEPAEERVLHDDRVEIRTGTEVTGVLGSFGDFRARILKRPRRVDPSACMGCGACAQACPVAVPDPMNGMLQTRKAIYLPYTGCLPNASAIDESLCLRAAGHDCTACAQACPFGAVRLDEGPEEEEILCGAIVVATGLENGEAFSARGGRIFTPYQMERILHPNGPTGGILALPDGNAPQAILLALTEGGRDDGPVAWSELMKLGHRLRISNPGIRLTFAGGPARPLGPPGDLAAELASSGAEFLPGTLSEVRETESGTPGVEAVLEDGGPPVHGVYDMAVFYPLSRPSRGATDLACILRLRTTQDGYFVDRAGPFEPAASGIQGICVAGCAGGPRTIAESIQDGASAAARILSILIPGERVPLECRVSIVDPERCGACGVCATSCSYGAVGRSPGERAYFVEPALCRGCGTCAAACPSLAITAMHFTRTQLLAEMEAILQRTSDMKGA